MRSVQDILQQNGSVLSRLLSQVATFDKITRCVRSTLDPQIAPYIHVMRYREGILVLRADSATWATRMRFSLAQLRTKLRTQAPLEGLKEIQLKVAPPM